jgi:hypothetical protein
MRYRGHGASRGDRKNVFCVIMENRKEREQLQDLGVNKINYT